MRWLRDIRNGTRNLWIWLPVIWRQRDWDFAYLYDVVYFKLKLMEKELRECTFVVGSSKEALNIRICMTLLKRIQEGNYLEEEFDVWHKENPLRFVKQADGSSKVVRTTEKQSKIFRRLIERETQLRKQDCDLFFKIFRGHHQRWWT